MREMGVTLNAWEYRMKWLGEDEATARSRASEVGTDRVGKGKGNTCSAASRACITPRTAGWEPPCGAFSCAMAFSS